ncbi:hypothetical protein [Desulfospira joergensenii]|uniref:hypothetical protein n=1 Tax=Desulfospira joergensenii TaxID=53329 RepID=UPI0003B693A6|nr:hypothetical protein [Desulfospira joergensenii]
MIKSIIKYFIGFSLAFILISPAVLFVSIVEKNPQVEKGPPLSFDKVKRVEQLIRTHKPRFMRFRQIRRIRILEQDLNLLANYGVSQLTGKDYIFPKVSLSAPFISFFATIKIPKTPFGEYLNPELVLKLDKNRPEIFFFRIGKLKIPKKIITPLASLIGQYFLSSEVYNLFLKNLDALRFVSIREKQLNFIYEWNPDSLLKLHESGKTLLVSPEHQFKLITYTNELTKLLDILKENHLKKISLSRVIRPLFQFAAGQSELSKDPVLENRALLQALSLYVIGEKLDPLVNADKLKQVKPRVDIRLTLYGREDLVKHFLVSAGLAVSAGTKLSQFAGIAKEVGDSNGGSGFSFADLAADRAGVMLGETAIASPSQANRIQRQMKNSKGESQFMPRIDRLPEGIMELEFKKRYTDLDSKAYALIDEEISRRIGECSVFR